MALYCVNDLHISIDVQYDIMMLLLSSNMILSIVNPSLIKHIVAKYANVVSMCIFLVFFA